MSTHIELKDKTPLNVGAAPAADLTSGDWRLATYHFVGVSAVPTLAEYWCIMLCAIRKRFTGRAD